MSDGITVIRTYGTELDAEIDAAVLKANGVPTQVSGDSARGSYPGMPVRLVVRAEDAALALEILDAPAESDDEDEAPSA